MYLFILLFWLMPMIPVLQPQPKNFTVSDISEGLVFGSNYKMTAIYIGESRAFEANATQGIKSLVEVSVLDLQSSILVDRMDITRKSIFESASAPMSLFPEIGGYSLLGNGEIAACIMMDQFQRDRVVVTEYEFLSNRKIRKVYYELGGIQAGSTWDYVGWSLGVMGDSQTLWLFHKRHSKATFSIIRHCNKCKETSVAMPPTTIGVCNHLVPAGSKKYCENMTMLVNDNSESMHHKCGSKDFCAITNSHSCS